MVKYWQIVNKFGCDVIEFNFLNEFGIRHGFVVKTKGFDIDGDNVYREMSHQYKTAVAKQVHGTKILAVDSLFKGFYPDRVEADGLMTNQAGVLITIHTADCVPIYLSSPDGLCVSLIHAGWKGTAEGIVSIAVNSICREYGLIPSDLVSVIGPGIESDCYQVGSEVAEKFPAEFLSVDGPGKWRLNLKTVNRRQLISAGLKPCNIYVCDLCTKCHPELFHSFRREKKIKGKMIAFMETGNG